MDRCICIHGHFYQPPRENAWLESIERQDSAHPYHDWNERITAECYAPNSASRILDDKRRIEHIFSNYSKMSFNFGPTLLAWMERQSPEVHQAILESDRESVRNFSGHGSAIAQAYNHLIMPLANTRDRYTQVLWGQQDFRHRFGRSPEGMWLPETAVDLETLDIMAELGIKYTILASRQAKRVRQQGTKTWRDLSEGKIDPSTPYLLRLSSGRTIALFFYHDAIAHAVAFEGLLSDGEKFYQRLLGAFGASDGPQLVHIATDGETYGHHHRFGDMALAYAIRRIESGKEARLTNYGEYLEQYPPTQEVEIWENTSWSCAHGVERWRSNCGCQTGAHREWNQSWRTPLRRSVDWLRDNIAPRFEQMARQFLKDPWAARDDYIEVILDRSQPNLEAFLGRHAVGTLDERDKVTALKLLELQRHAMLMFTSDGWFFDDISGIETVQMIQYAGRAVQLSQELFGASIEPRFLAILEGARSNVAEQGNGRGIYDKAIRPAMVDLRRVAAHYALSSLFREYPPQARVHSYQADRDDYRVSESGATRLALGKVRIVSGVTLESATMSFAVVHLGDHNLHAGVQEYKDEGGYQATVRDLSRAFQAGDLPRMMRLLDSDFAPPTYSLKSLFRDEQRLILDRILESTLAEIETEYRQLYERNYNLMRFLVELGNPLPNAFHYAVELVLNADLRRALGREPLSSAPVKALLDQAEMWAIHLDKEELGLKLAQTLEKLMHRFVSEPANTANLRDMEDAVSLAAPGRFDVNLWKVQNIYYRMLKDVYPAFLQRGKAGDAGAQDWIARFSSLGERFSVKVP
ncbi:MAG: DUF3536 domain-containing protein [Dehalococcoidia bacterium]|nr:DUF3536 domain-containing protein [Dehalococcoidia bacterium]